MSSSSPEAKPAQPKDDAQVPSEGEGPCFAPHPVLLTSHSQSLAWHTDLKVEPSAPVTNSQAPPPPSSEKPPLPPSDSTPATATPDPEKHEGQDPTTTAGTPAEPGSRVPDAQERYRKRRLLIIHTRLARFFTWILLLGFVILPSTFTRAQADNQNPSSSGSGTVGSDLTHSAINHIANLSLYVPFSLIRPIHHLFLSSLTSHPKDSRLVTYAASSTHSRSPGSGTSGRTTTNGCSPTYSPPD